MYQWTKFKQAFNHKKEKVMTALRKESQPELEPITERQIIKLILNRFLLQQVGRLDSPTRRAIRAFELKFWEALHDNADLIIEGFCDKRIDTSGDRNAFAKSIHKHVDPRYYKYFFAVYDSKNVLEIMKQDILRHLSSDSRLDSVRFLINNHRYTGAKCETRSQA